MLSGIARHFVGCEALRLKYPLNFVSRTQVSALRAELGQTKGSGSQSPPKGVSMETEATKQQVRESAPWLHWLWPRAVLERQPTRILLSCFAPGIQCCPTYHVMVPCAKSLVAHLSLTSDKMCHQSMSCKNMHTLVGDRGSRASLWAWLIVWWD